MSFNLTTSFTICEKYGIIYLMSGACPGLATIEPFVYIRDTAGVIHYVISSADHEGEAGYTTASVYYPDESGESTHSETGANYVKSVFHGYDSERESVLKNVPKPSADYVLSLAHQGDISNPQYLFLPTSSIAKRYDPHASLDAILAHEDVQVDSRIVDAIGASILAFESVGIPSAALGLYGGLQCGMVKKDLGSNGRSFKDVDILVRGTGYVDGIAELAAKYAAPPLNRISDPVRFAESRRRREIAQFTIPGVESVHCDVRVLRGESDPNDYCDEISMEPTPITINVARVTNADQSLSLPFAYQIDTNEEGPLRVSGMHYHCLGVAAVGDQVRVQGLRINPNTIILSDPDGDHIVSV
jgi:predicted nucleotidyltransferase